MKKIIRVKKISFKNLRNAKSATVTFPSLLSPDENDILSIFGRNGSGKSAVIEALLIIELSLSGSPFPPFLKDVITVGDNSTEISLTLTFGSDIVLYTLTFQKKEKELSFSESIERVRGEKKDVIHTEERAIFLNNKKKAEINDCATSSSLLFSAGFDEVLKLCPYLNEIKEYASSSFVVIPSVFLLSFRGKLPLLIQKEIRGKVSFEKHILDLNEELYINEEKKLLITNFISKINPILSTLIPSMKIEMNINRKEGEFYIAELFSHRNDRSIPLRYESDGTLKLIALIPLLLFVYNTPSSFLAIDELDASIHEYLLGEIVKVFRKECQGQLLFSCHSLRILEMLDWSNVMFSSPFSEDKYVRMKKGKSRNLRDAYLRSIFLNSDMENEECSSQEIAMALKKAWKKK